MYITVLSSLAKYSGSDTKKYILLSDLSQEILSGTPTFRPRITNRKTLKRGITDVDKSFVDYLQRKTKKLRNSKRGSETKRRKSNVYLKSVTRD